MKRVLRFAWLVMVLITGGLAFADDAESAQRAYEAKQWTSAADLYGKLTQAESRNPLYWYRLGNASRHAGDLAKGRGKRRSSRRSNLAFSR